MAGVFFTLTPKKIEGSREPDFRFNLLPSLNDSLNALSEGVRDQKPKYEAAIQRLADLRAQLSLHWGRNVAIESHDKFLSEVLRPYMQLLHDVKIYFTLPSDEVPGDAARQLQGSAPVHFLAFQWKCAFASTYLLSGNVDVEMCAIFFNLGVMFFNKATHTMYSSAESDACTSAFKDFQTAAGAWKQAEDLAKHLPLAHLSFDLHPSSFQWLEQIATGMAHRCAYMKACAEPATKDNTALLSKLALTGAKHLNQTAEMSAPLMEGRNINGDYRIIVANIKDNAAMLEGEAYEHVIKADLKANECGAAMAKSRVAMAIVAAQINASASDSNKQWLSAKCGDLKAQHDEAVHLNNTVYFQKVPEAIDPLPTMERILGKPTPFFEDWAAVDTTMGDGGSPFKGLVGPDIIPLLAKFREQITAEFGRLSKTVTDSRTEASEALSALQLDAILCQSEEGMQPRLPATLRERVEKLQNQAQGYDPTVGTGTPEEQAAQAQKMTPALMIQAMLRHVANVAAAVDPILTESDSILQRERERDEGHARTYGEKLWRSRIKASDELPDVPQFRKRVAELRNSIGTEIKAALQSIVKTLNEQAQPLLRVGMPVTDLDAMIPTTQTPTAEQQAVTNIRERLVNLRHDFDAINENEMTLLRSIPPLINAPDVATALSASRKNDREEVLSKKQVEFIDHFAGVTALSEQRTSVLHEMEKLVADLAVTSSKDPLFQQKAEVLKSIERGIQVVEGAVMRISDLSAQVAQVMENSNVLRQSCLSLYAARDVEAKNVAADMDAQVAQQMARMNSDELSQFQAGQVAAQKQSQQQMFNHAAAAAMNDPNSAGASITIGGSSSQLSAGSGSGSDHMSPPSPPGSAGSPHHHQQYQQPPPPPPNQPFDPFAPAIQ